MLDCQLFGLNPGAQHLVNVFFHAANTLLLFHLLKRMTREVWPSAIVAALFALHPLHVESVAWIAERKDVLSTFFGLLTIWAYSRYTIGEWRLTSAVSSPRPGSSGFKVQGSRFKVCYCFGAVCLCPGAHGEAHVGDDAVCAVVAGLLAVGEVSEFRSFGGSESWSANPGVGGDRQTSILDSSTLKLSTQLSTLKLSNFLDKLPFLLLSIASSAVTVLRPAGRGIGDGA